MIETRSIKFYLNDKVNKSKKEKIIKFLKECQQVENYLLQYYWEHFNIIIDTKSKIDMTYNKDINYKDTKPILKSHHFYSVLGQCFWELKSIQSNIENRIYFKFEDKSKQKVYNYCKGFIFHWDKLSKAIVKESQKEKKNLKHQEFITEVLRYINDNKLFNQLQKDVENKFWEIKSKYKIPEKKELQIWVDTYLTTVIEKKEFDWFFIVDNNEIVGGTKKKAAYGDIVIPVKFSNYHKQLLDGVDIKKSINLKLNKYNKIEITVVYDKDVKYQEPHPKDYLGIDIGLKNLITDSNGNYIKQNTNIIYKANKILTKQANRQTLEEHLKVKYQDSNYKLGYKRYLKQQNKLSDYVKNDNRYKVKEYLKGHTDYHIVMENLKIGYKKTPDKRVNYLLKRLRIQYLIKDILLYAKRIGIKITQVNPAFTSQQCPCCGHISKDNRKTQETFCCVECGHTDNADVNASINIKNRLFIPKIKFNTPLWKIKEILIIE